MGHNFEFVGVRNEVHAAVLSSGELQGHPYAEAQIVFGWIPIGFVLMPRGRSGVERWFVDGVVTDHDGFGTEQLLHDRLEITHELGGHQFGGELGGL